jgi:hypothetical protein
VREEVDLMKYELMKVACPKCDRDVGGLTSADEAEREARAHDAEMHHGERVAVRVSESGIVVA